MVEEERRGVELRSSVLHNIVGKLHIELEGNEVEGNADKYRHRRQLDAAGDATWWNPHEEGDCGSRPAAVRRNALTGGYPAASRQGEMEGKS